jgi:hypothetical protein
MRPLRRTILQFSQIRLTLERTFMTELPFPGDATIPPVPAGCFRLGAINLPFDSSRNRTAPNSTDHPRPGRRLPTPRAAQIAPVRNRAIICEGQTWPQVIPPRNSGPATSWRRGAKWTHCESLSWDITFGLIRGGSGQDQRAGGRKGDRVLEMDTRLAILGPHRPMVFFAGSGPL